MRAVLSADGDACVVPVYAQPRASRTAVVGVHDGMLKIALAAPPVDGEANAALVRFFAAALGVPRGAVTLMAGATGRRKRVRVEGLDPDQVAGRLAG